MILINFELLKLRKKIKLEVPVSSTFLQLSELIFKTFNLNKASFDNRSSKLLFIYKCVACKYERTIESYQINNNSTIYVSIPKQIYDSFSSAVKNNHPKSTNPSTSKYPPEISLKPSEEKEESNSLINQQMVINFVNKDSLKTLVEFGYNELDAAYAIAYKTVLEGAIEFLDKGLASDLHIRRCIEKVVKARLTQQTDDILRYSIEIIKVEGAQNGENVEVSIAAAIGIFATHTNIQDPSYKEELKEYVRKVQQKYPGQAPLLFQAHLAHMQADPKINQIYREFYCQDQNTNQFNGQNQGQFYGQNSNQFNGQIQGQFFGQNFNQFYGQNQGQFYGQNLSQFYNQNQGLNNYGQKQMAISETRNKFWAIFNSLPTMTPQNFINPFKATVNDFEMVISNSSQNDFFYSYGSQLNYEQLMFLYRMLKERNIEISISIMYLSHANGNVKVAETLISKYK